MIDHAFNDNVSLRNRTVYADYDKFYQNVFAGGPVDPATGLVPLAAYNNEQLRENVFNQTDLTFSFATGSIGHDFLAGVELGEQVTDNFRQTGFFNGTDLLFPVDAGDPTVSVPVTFAQAPLDNDNHGRATIAAAYVQDQIQLTPQWLAVLGLRYDNFDMDFTNNRTGENFRTSDDLLSPRGGLIYKPVEDVSLYASYSMTYVPRAGSQLASLAVTNAAFDPEEFENIEVGAKWVVSPRSRSAAVFQLDRKNVIIPDPSNPTDPAASLLVDGQRTEGVELGQRAGFRGLEHPGRLRLAGRPPDGGPRRDRLAQLPEHVVSLWNCYDFTPAWGVGLGVIHQTEMYASADNLVTLPEFARGRGRLLRAERAPEHAAQRREPVRRGLLPERAQQQQHHAGLAPGRPVRRDRELLVRQTGRRVYHPATSKPNWGISQCTRRISRSSRAPSMSHASPPWSRPRLQETTVFEPVIVTAQKREQNIYEVPVAISAFSADTIERKGIADLTDIGKFVRI